MRAVILSLFIFITLSFITFSFVQSSQETGVSGISFVQPDQTTTIKVQFNPASNVLFNRQGPSVVRLKWFGKILELKIPKGTPYVPDPQHYDVSVPALEFKVSIPAQTKVSELRLKLETELYLCDALKHVCYRSTPTIQTRLVIGKTGKNQPVMIELKTP